MFRYFSLLLHYTYQEISVLSTPLYNTLYNALCYKFIVFMFFLKTINNNTGIDSAIQSEQVETLDPASCSSSICTAEP